MRALTRHCWFVLILFRSWFAVVVAIAVVVVVVVVVAAVVVVIAVVIAIVITVVIAVVISVAVAVALIHCPIMKIVVYDMLLFMMVRHVCTIMNEKLPAGCFAIGRLPHFGCCCCR